MKRLLCLILVCLSVKLVDAQSGQGYDPESPADPNVLYTLTLEVSPRSGGTIDSNIPLQMSAGESTFISTSPRIGYKFKHWMAGDSLISGERDFTFTMPAHNVVLTAYFEPSKYYDPENPGDPAADGYSHKVNVYAMPSTGGYFNSSGFYLTEGKTTNIYAYPREGYRFESWMCNGEIVSTDNPLLIRMGTTDMDYTATFVYNPSSPEDPASNHFDQATGEVLIDNFEPGLLNDAIHRVVGGYENFHLVHSITVIGRMKSSDFGFAYLYPECRHIDLSRTTGYTEMPAWSFENAEALTEVILPTSVEKICDHAFRDCPSLTDIYLYATIPPLLEEHSLDGLDKSVTLHVPSASLALYTAAEGWERLTIASLDKDEKSITISLPGEQGTFRNMTIELQNDQSGQTYRCLVTDRKSYTFYGLIKDTRYSAYLKTQDNKQLAEIHDIFLRDEDLSINFTHIETLNDLMVAVLDCEGNDVTPDVTVTWLDDKLNYIRTGNRLTGQTTGSTVIYRIRLDSDLAMKHAQPEDISHEVKTGDNTIIHTLRPIERISWTGLVRDSSSGEGISGAMVSVTQTLNDRYPSTIIAKTDNKGQYNIHGFREPATITVSAYDYIDCKVEVNPDNSKESMEIPPIDMTSIIGGNIILSLSYTPSVEEGETPQTQNLYNDPQNVTYHIRNISTGHDVTHYSMRYPRIVILDGARAGERLTLTASSKKNCFMPVSTEVVIGPDNSAKASFPIVQKGIFTAEVTNTPSEGIHGMIYNNKGILVGDYNFTSDRLILEDLDDGAYSLIVMTNNPYIRSIFSISQIEEVGLEENVDFIRADFEITSGKKKSLHLPELPTFDGNKFRFIDRMKNHTGVNKSVIVAGNYLTGGGSLNFIQDYIDEITDVSIIVDIPDEAAFVEKSVLLNGLTAQYTYSDRRLNIPVSEFDKETTVKFCIIPTAKGKYSPTMFVTYNVDGIRYFLPIGSMDYTVLDATISLNETVTTPEISIQGTALNNSTVRIYDRTTLIGQTGTSNGHWELTCNLPDSYNLSKHPVYARITTAENAEYETETVICTYDKDAIVPKSIRMVTPSGFEMLFDYLRLKSDFSGYSVSGGTFTFIVDFTNNDPSYLTSVNIYVHTESGGFRNITATYDEKTDRWVGSEKFSSTDQPINVSLDFSARYESTLDLSPLEDNISEAQALIEEEEKMMNISILRINTLIRKLDKGDMTSDELQEDLRSVITVLDEDTSIRTQPEDIPIIDYLNTLDGEELDKAIAKERTKRNHEPSEDFNDLNKQLTKPIDQTFRYDEESPTIRAITTKAILDTLDNSINAVDSKWNTDLPESPIVNFSNGEGGNIVVDLRSVLPMPDNSDEAYSDWIGKAENLLQKNSSIIADGTSTILDIAERIAKKEIARSSGELAFAKELINLKISQNVTIKDAPVYRIMLTDLKDERIRLRDARKFQSTTSTISNVVSGAGSFLNGWGIGADIRDGWSINEEWNYLIRSIKECDDPEAALLAYKADEHRKWIKARFISKGCLDVSSASLSIVGATAAPTSFGLSLLLNCGCLLTDIYTSRWETEFLRTNHDNLRSIMSEYEKLKCIPKDTDEAPSPPFKSVNISRDPSGYVYEGVSSNRLQGVTATAYHMTSIEDMYGVIHEVPTVWKAEEYAQENPLFTDADGMYQWDVPQGLWQVKFEKEGYETTLSDWLPVPPPQLDVNIGMVQSRQPEIRQAHAYRSGIEIEFDKYMMPVLLNCDNILVSQEGEYVRGIVELLDEETAYKDESKKYASRVRFVPENPFTASEIMLTVSNRVKSYAGVQMQDIYQQSFDIEQELSEIRAPHVVNVRFQEATTFTVKVLPESAAAGKVLLGKSTSPMIVSLDSDNYVLDKNGKTEITVTGELPGASILSFAVDGYEVKASSTVNVDIYETPVCATPVASIPSGMVVDKGTQVELYCKTEGSKIYYTVDGSCPCDDSPSRYEYLSPIIIDKATTIKAMASASNHADSEIAEYSYNVKEQEGIDNVELNNGIEIYPIPIRDYLIISAGEKMILNIGIFSLNGNLVSTSSAKTRKATLKVDHLPKGIYIVQIATEDGTFSSKIQKTN